MRKTTFMDKYPVCSFSIKKEEIDKKSIDEIIAYFNDKIDKHPIAKFIAVFEHYSHTKSIEGEIMEGLLDAKNIIFCFGKAIPNTKMLAVRPRSISVCEFDKSFIIEFMEAPKEEMQNIMETWVKELLK